MKLTTITTSIDDIVYITCFKLDKKTNNQVKWKFIYMVRQHYSRSKARETSRKHEDQANANTPQKFLQMSHYGQLNEEA